MIRDSIVKLSQKHSLTEGETHEAMLEILEGKATPAQIGSYLSFLAYKGETAEEIIGSVKAMREKMLRIDAEGLNAIDVCGTGGDHQGTFNISTAAALVLAGGGVVVAKHGNRAASSQCGSAEVLDTLGVKLDITTRAIENCLREAGIGFLFAPHFHPAMKNVAPIRKELGVRTLFNILGPMCNPASVKRQVIGVFDSGKARLIGEALMKSGSEKVITLSSEDGLDEVSSAAATKYWEYPSPDFPKGWQEQAHPSSALSPEYFGFARSGLQELKGADAATNAKIILAIFGGEKGPKREAVIMNAAVGFYVAGKCATIKDGREMGEESLDSGKALKALEALKKVSHQ